MLDIHTASSEPSLLRPAHRWLQTSTRCLQAKGTCWSVVGWLRSKVKGKWRPTSLTMDRPTVSSHGSSSTRCRDWSPHPDCKDTAPLSEDSQCERMAKKTRDAIPWIPKQRGKKINFWDFKKEKCSWWEENVWQPFWPHVHVEGQVFFSCLASLSGFLKDAKSVYLKQRLLACVKRRLTLYIRLLFIFFLCVLFQFFPVIFNFTWILNRYSYFLFSLDLIIYFDLNVFVQKVLYEKVWIHTCTNIQFITRL